MLEGSKATKKVWDVESDRILVENIAVIGPRQWDRISRVVQSRSGKQCRERWNNQLNPLVNKKAWRSEEVWILFLLQRNQENRWSHISDHLLGRTDNAIKNYWNTTLKNKTVQYKNELACYVNKCLAINRQKNINASKEKIEKHLFNFMIRKTQFKYYEYLKNLYEGYKLEAKTSPKSKQKVLAFYLMLLKKTIDITKFCSRQDEADIEEVNKKFNLQADNQLKFHNSVNLSSEFYQIFLGGKTSESIYRLITSLQRERL